MESLVRRGVRTTMAVAGLAALVVGLATPAFADPTTPRVSGLGSVPAASSAATDSSQSTPSSATDATTSDPAAASAAQAAEALSSLSSALPVAPPQVRPALQMPNAAIDAGSSS
jgi:hypothetical protein